MTGRNLFGIPLPAGAVFVVSNRRGAELAIAQMKDKSVATEATDATPDVKTVGNPFFLTPQSAAQVQ